MPATSDNEGTDRAARLELEQLRLFRKTVRPSIVAGPIAAIAISFIFSPWVAWPYLVAWAGAIVLFSAFHAFYLDARLAAVATIEDVARWRRIVVLWRGSSQIVWVLPGLSFWVAEDQLNHLLLILYMAANLSNISAISSPIRSVGYVSCAPFAIVMIARPLFEQEPFYYGLSIALAVYAYYQFNVFRQMHETTRDMLLLRDEKSELIEKLEEACQRAEHANAAKSDFLAAMSHELRTPLNAIIGFSELIKEELLGPERRDTYREYAQDINASGHHLLQLINDVLDLSKIEAGRLELIEEEVSLDKCVGEAARLLNVRCRKSKVTMVTDVEPGFSIIADERAVKQMIINLTTNAVKFTPAGGTVTVSARQRSEGVVAISITDTGCGIPEEDLPRVFERFGQSQHGKALIKDKGTGLGLPIVKALIEAHGGHIHLASQLGVGTTVTLTFPQSRTKALVHDAA